jgi:hypothetical protein
MSDAVEQIIADEAAAYVRFRGRWETRALQALDPALFDDLAEQQRIFHEVQEGDDEEQILLHGAAMIRGWEIALRRMEEAEIGRAKAVFPDAVIRIREK